MEFNPLADPCFTCGLYRDKKHPCIRPKTYQLGAITFIGEAPGEQEDKKDEAFVGAAGQILRESLNELFAGQSRVGCYNLLNAVKCRPTKDGKNRTPTAKEVKLCNEFLLDELDHIRPSIVVCLGRVAASATGISEGPLRDLRNRSWPTKWGEAFVTYHPAYSLKPGMAHIKQEFTNDLKLYLTAQKSDIDTTGEVCYNSSRMEEEITIDIETSGFFKDHDVLPFDGKGEILLIGVDSAHITN